VAVEEAAPARRQVTRLEIWGAEDIAPAFAALKAQADALYVVGNALTTANRTRIITLALGARLPTILTQTGLSAPP
jgi:hypothetical protein